MSAREERVGYDAAAAFFNVTRRTIENWVRDGAPHRKGDGPNGAVTFSLAELARFDKEKSLERALAKSTGNLDESAERVGKLRAERLLKELELAKATGVVVDAAVAEQRFAEIFGGFSAVAAGRLTTFERKMIATKTPADARRLTTAMHAALMEGARTYADELEAQAEALEAAAAEADRERGAGA